MSKRITVLMDSYTLAGMRCCRGKFEATDGTSYTIDAFGSDITITRDVWDAATQDWRSEPVAQAWPAFAAAHGIGRLVS